MKVFSCTQAVGHMVIIPPSSFFSSVSCGYSVSEHAHFLPHDWLMLADEASKVAVVMVGLVVVVAMVGLVVVVAMVVVVVVMVVMGVVVGGLTLTNAHHFTVFYTFPSHTTQHHYTLHCNTHYISPHATSIYHIPPPQSLQQACVVPMFSLERFLVSLLTREVFIYDKLQHQHQQHQQPFKRHLSEQQIKQAFLLLNKAM